MQPPQIDHNAVPIIIELGPYSVDELRQFPETRLEDYFLVMQAQLKRLGPEEFAASKEMLRNGTEAQILRDPPTY